MTKRKSAPSEKTVEKNDSLDDTKHPLVFISHDTRDAELAEEFSNLLKNASAGALKSFRSSDKKGTQGIDYGQEWYPAIMNKIDEASDVVCLLTHHSVDRPWILYEAGVAKGKLDKKVIGIALGIPLSAAITGPFAQFQNNDGDSESITKLVLELVRKVPNLDPDPGLVKDLVDKFITKSKEITDKLKPKAKTDKAENVDENSVAKLFEEVKIMFDSLPSKIESKLDPEMRRRKQQRPQSMIFNELSHSQSLNPQILFLIVIGFYREDFTWFYELGMDAYRELKSVKTTNEKEKIIKRISKAIEML
jgi:hypothetical protein